MSDLPRERVDDDWNLTNQDRVESALESLKEAWDVLPLCLEKPQDAEAVILLLDSVISMCARIEASIIDAFGFVANERFAPACQCKKGGDAP